MMLNKVIVGKGAKSGYSSALTAPPPGYDSVSNLSFCHLKMPIKLKH